MSTPKSKQCEKCGEAFEPWRATSAYCSKKCANEATGERREAEGALECEWCHERKGRQLFSRVKRSGKQVYQPVCLACLAGERARKKEARHWYHDEIPQMLCNCRYRAAERGVEFSLAREHIVIPERCPVFGTSFKEGYERGGTFSESYAPSIDRIDNHRGYTPDNIVFVSCRANSIKGDASIDELVRVADFYRELKV